MYLSQEHACSGLKELILIHLEQLTKNSRLGNFYSLSGITTLGLCLLCYILMQYFPVDLCKLDNPVAKVDVFMNDFWQLRGHPFRLFTHYGGKSVKSGQMWTEAGGCSSKNGGSLGKKITSYLLKFSQTIYQQYVCI